MEPCPVEASPGQASSQTPQPGAEDRRLDTERNVLRKLWQIYSDKVLPIEAKSFYKHFSSEAISREEFESRPQVLLLGQYSTGKTSMIRWLTEVETNYLDVRPQPCTDKFIAVVHGDEERLIHGNAAACLPQLPYQGLSKFGGSFLSSFQALVLPSKILKEITFIDTPGVLSGSKQRIGRDYDFAEVSAWMAKRADLVFLTFDAHKLDISDEFQEVMEVLRPYADKVRCVLNKADQIDATNLVRVYGALLWNVGKVLQTPEIAKVFVSSFWNEEYRYKAHEELFDQDKQAVQKELAGLPRTALLRKIDMLAKRVSAVKTHLLIMSHLRSKMTGLMNMVRSEDTIKKNVCELLPDLLAEAQRMYELSPGDMPKLEDLKAKIMKFDGLSKLRPLDKKDTERLQQINAIEIPQLLAEVSGVTSSVAKESLDPKEGGPSNSWFGGLPGFSGKRKRSEGECP